MCKQYTRPFSSHALHNNQCTHKMHVYRQAGPSPNILATSKCIPLLSSCGGVSRNLVTYVKTLKYFMYDCKDLVHAFSVLAASSSFLFSYCGIENNTSSL